jgi:hypothetical protein
MRSLLVLIVAVALASHPTAALAYVDPGTGMMLLQGLIAAIGAVAVVVGRPFRWLRRKLKPSRRPDAGS